MEIADIFVVNKADHPMADQLRREIRSMMEMLQWPGWVPELVTTQALEGKRRSTSCGARSNATPPISTRPARSSGGAATPSRIKCASSRWGAWSSVSNDALNAQPRDDLDPYEAAERILSKLGLGRPSGC